MTPSDPHLDELLGDLADHTGPDDLALARLRRRLRPVRSRASLSPPRTPLWVHGATLAAAAATALLLVQFLWRGPPGEHPLSSTRTATWQASPHVALSYSGEGVWRAGRHAAELQWDLGRLDVDVVPNQGVQLMVRTTEATVNVVGTHFVVERGPLGTLVTVDRGEVELACTGGAWHSLTDGHRRCPRSPQELHAHAVDLVVGEADPADVLEAVDLGLAGAPDRPLTYELLALRASALAQLGRTEELRQTLRRYLDGGPPMRAEAFEAWLNQLDADATPSPPP